MSADNAPVAAEGSWFDRLRASSIPDVQATFCATVVDEWVRAGLTDAVVCPGSRSTPMTLAFAADDRVRLHVHHDERSAGFLALGAAAVTRRPVAVVTTSGTATVNLHPAVVEADLSGVPLLVCTTDRPWERRDVAAPQTVDQERLYGRSTRWYVDPGVPDAAQASTWRSVAARAWAEATAPWAGPVQLNLPFREPLVGTPAVLPPGRSEGPWTTRRAAERVAPTLDPDLARRPGIVVAGRGAVDVDGVRALADALGWPVLADPMSGCGGRGAIAGFDPLLRTSFAAETRPEVVLRVGGPPASKVLAQWLDGLGAAELVVAAPGFWPDPDRSVALVLDEVPVAPEGITPDLDWLDRWIRASGAVQDAIDRVLVDVPLSEPAVARTVGRLSPPGGLVVASSSMPIRDLEWFGLPRRDVRCWSNRGANGIDGVVSTAVGAALAGVRTTLVIGDIAFLHDVNGLLGAADRGIDLTIVVLDNDGGGIFSFLPQRTQLPTERFERLFGTPHGLDLVAVARAHGVEAAPVTDAADLVWEPGMRVLVVAGDRAENVAVHQRLDEAAAEAVAALD